MVVRHKTAANEPVEAGFLTVEDGPRRRFAEFWINLLAAKGVALHVGSGNVKHSIPYTPLKEFCRENLVLYQNVIDVLKQRKIPRDRTIEEQLCPVLGLKTREEIGLALILAAQARLKPEYQDLMEPLIQKCELDTGIIRGKRLQTEEGGSNQKDRKTKR